MLRFKVVELWNGSLVIEILQLGKFMREKPFLELFQTKGLGEGGERHVKEV